MKEIKITISGYIVEATAQVTEPFWTDKSEKELIAEILTDPKSMAADFSYITSIFVDS
jgi:hypothetical protein